MKKIIASVLVIVSVLMLGACAALPAPTEDPNAISFREVDLTGSDRLVLRNLHSGRESEITDPAAILEISDFIRGISAGEKQSHKDREGGIYQLTAWQGSTLTFSVEFWDNSRMVTGDYGDGHPCGYRMIGLTTQEVADFFTPYDSSLQ